MIPTIATYWWTAPGKGYQAYGPDDVRRLARMVKANMHQEHRFVVVTDAPSAFYGDDDIVAVPLEYDTHIPGTCFIRLMTFNKKSAETIGPRVLQMDLDALIVGPLDGLFDKESPIVMWRNPARLPYAKPKVAGRPFYNTSLLLPEK